MSKGKDTEIKTIYDDLSVDELKEALKNIFFYAGEFTDADMEEMAERIISAAQRCGIPLEKNESSKREANYYWEEFWQMAEERVEAIRGLDAHSLKELIAL